MVDPHAETAPKLSFVIPVYNEDESLGELLASIHASMAASTDSYEIVFVDDGSTDGTFQTLRTVAEVDGRVRLFSFRRNLGKSVALLCGFQKARGEFILTMDADLQDDPANLGRMRDCLVSEDADVVSGWRRERRDKTVKVLFSRLFNRLVVRWLFGTCFKDMNSGIKLYRADVARELHLYGGLHRFIPLILTMMGYRVVECPVSHGERRHGVSKYSPAKILTEMPDLLTVFFLVKYTTRPLHFFGRIGGALIAVGFLCLAYLTILWTVGIGIGTRPLLMFGVLLMVIGGQTVFTGLLADLIVKVSHDGRPKAPLLKYASDQVAEPWGARPRSPGAYSVLN